MSFWHILAYFIDLLISDLTIDFEVLVEVANLPRTKSWCGKVLFVSKNA